MIYKDFKGIKLSALGMGCMRLPEVAGAAEKTFDYEASKAIIDYAYAHGINYYDTAFIYGGGQSEIVTGKALAEYPRESFYVADKFNLKAMPDYEKQFAIQLERLQMDYIDFYLLHGIQDNAVEDYLTCGCIEYFEKLKKEGKIRYLGFSFHGSEASLLKILDRYADWDFVQIQLNYYDWEYGNQRRLYEILAERQIAIMVMEPVHGGLLARLNDKATAVLKEADAEASTASWALRFVYDLPACTVILSGMSDMDQIIDNVKTFETEKPFTDEDKALVKKAAELLRPDVSLPCTGCRYCTADCPMQLDIPTLLRYYNDMKTDSAWRLMGIMGLPEDKQPSACIGCGSCTDHCPQSLPIPDAMKEMAQALEAFKKR